MPFARLGRYEVKGWLGGGRFGDVYLALDPLTQREVAVKVVRFQGDATPYLEEVRNLARLDHPAIVRFYTVDLLEGRLLIITEVVKGESLREVLNRGRMSRERALEVAGQLLDALNHAHERGVVHRDIKPENVMITPEGKVNVLDFGLSRLAQGDLSMSMGGTPAYMAPENWKGIFTPASDQWSAAVVILEMLTGLNPFAGDTLEEVRNKTQQGVKEGRLTSLLPQDLVQPLLRALAPEPEERFPSCKTFLEELVKGEGEKVALVVRPLEKPEGLPPLTREQRQAVEDLSPRILVTGGPGTGKTTVLLARALHLLKKGEAPESIALLTFSFRSWKEMEARLEQTLGEKYRGIWLGNFHQIAFRVVSRFGHLLDLPREFSLALPAQQERIAQEAAVRAGGEKASREILKAFSQARIWGTPWEEVASKATGRWREMLESFEYHYLQLIRDRGVLGYEDVLYYALRLLEMEEVATFYRERLNHILVDDVQDLDRCQIALVEALSQGGNLFLVGDDDQAIYQWRGAHPSYIRGLKNRGFTHHRLNQTFRLPPEFREMAISLISRNRERMPKLYWTSREEGRARPIVQPLKTPKDEAEYVADMVEILRIKEGYSYSDFAILYRVKTRGRLIEQVLKKRKLPFTQEGGRTFLDREEVRVLLDLLAFLARGKSATIQKRLLKGASPLLGGRDRAVQELERTLGALEPQMKPSQALELGMETLNRLMSRAESSLLVTRMEAMETLLKKAKEFEESARSPTVANFLKYIRFLRDAGLAGGEEGIRLLSVHGAKGLEFPVVFVVGMVEGEFPLARALGVPQEMEEERRLCYTAVTRATEVLFITYYRYSSSQARFQETPSIFIKEMLGVG
ncbi:MAG TPA: hypothetical protein ENF32_05280 [Thermosulfidibacter takaii]|uniref:DNA 3'-5' helicase n=1 Tax=Thermosulfidibacter takaii TaxID=412593 RepID=A0A7C0U6T9_9BACT|nr:hypothetical protein [Thermosulfidibacter takaii]